MAARGSIDKDLTQGGRIGSILQKTLITEMRRRRGVDGR